MDPLTMTAASGMRSRMETLDLLANNLANASAPGFKADREFYNLYISAEASDSSSQDSSTTAPVIEKHWTDFTQGSMTATSNPMNLAIAGKGFFTVSSPSGALFTRDGTFRLSAQGDLETQEGYKVTGQDGKPIRLDAGKEIEIDRDGVIRQGGLEAGRLKVSDFSDAHGLMKQGQSYFFASSGNAPIAATGAEIQQGKLESANFQTAESAVKLVTVMRQFESLQKAMSVGNDMNKKSIEEVARVE